MKSMLFLLYIKSTLLNYNQIEKHKASRKNHQFSDALDGNRKKLKKKLNNVAETHAWKHVHIYFYEALFVE